MRTLIGLSLLLGACGGAQNTAPQAVEAPADEQTKTEVALVHNIRTETVEYSSGATKLKGYFAWDAAQEGLRPGVIVVHEWWGHNDYVQARARKLAEEGYTAFAIDMYGDGKTADHPKDAMAFMQEALSDIPAAKARFEAGIEQLKNHPTTDPEKMA
ncbi:MAG: dienelactone hydrolase family protein, partial [Myxococcales bacterium]|nr:dienelactone hydrolase family protein [Myxococcales bacterium]